MAVFKFPSDHRGCPACAGRLVDVRERLPNNGYFGFCVNCNAELSGTAYMTLPDDVYAFTDRNGKECQVGIFFEYRAGPSYALIQDGERVGGRQPIPSDNDVPGFLLNISREMGATSWRRLEETAALGPRGHGKLVLQPCRGCDQIAPPQPTNQ